MAEPTRKQKIDLACKQLEQGRKLPYDRQGRKGHHSFHELFALEFTVSIQELMKRHG